MPYRIPYREVHIKTWCIINLSNLHDGFDNLPDPPVRSFLDKKHGPSVFYYDRSEAERELFRLQKKNPADDFFLFESVRKAVPRGKVIMGKQERNVYCIEEPDAFDAV